jgi:hypothetical protein
LNDRLRSGRRRRRIGTEMDTSVNAASVPMLTISSSLPIGVSSAISATVVPMTTVSSTGVPVRSLVRPSRGGRRWSRDIAKLTLVAPISRVMTTVAKPATAPALMIVA